MGAITKAVGPCLDYYVVCLIDILGFSEMVRRDSETHPTGQKHLAQLYELHNNLFVGEDATILSDRIQFSDTVIFSLPFTRDLPKIERFLAAVSRYQYALFMNSILSRGGVAHGKHFSKGTFLFSQALIEAYNLEQNVARYPRIAVSSDFLDLVYENTISPSACSLIRAEDGVLFLDFLGNGEPANIQPVLSGLLANAQDQTSVSVGEKVSWLVDYFNFRFPHATLKSKPRFENISQKSTAADRLNQF